MKNKYYIISSENVGPNAKPLNCEAGIYTTPGITNGSHEEKISGWLGTTNDIAQYAHGEFKTLRETRSYIKKHWPGFTPITEDFMDDEIIDDLVDSYKDQRIVWSVDEYLYEWAEQEITAQTTDDEIIEHAEMAEVDAERENIYIDGDCVEYFTKIRDEKREDEEKELL